MQNIKDAKDDWKKRGSLPDDRIIPGSAVGYLLKIGVAGEKLKKELGTWEGFKPSLEKLIENSQEMQDLTGIPVIKKNIEHYLQYERVDILKKRCDKPIQEIMETVRAIQADVGLRFSNDPDFAKQEAALLRTTNYHKWWSRKWEEIRAEIKRYCRTSIETTSIQDEYQKNKCIIKRLEDRYQQTITEEFKKLPSLQEERRKVIFDSVAIPHFDGRKANDKWRDSLYNEVMDALYKISCQLSNELYDEIQALLDVAKTNEVNDTFEYNGIKFYYLTGDKQIQLLNKSMPHYYEESYIISILALGINYN